MRFNFKGMDKVLDLIWVNLLFVVCCLPVFTIGAATTAMYDTLRRVRRGEGRIFSLYFCSFKNNFKQATRLWLLQVLLMGGTLVNLWMVSGWTGALYLPMSALLLAVMVFILAWGTVLYPQIAVFENTTSIYAKNALILAAAHPVKSIIFAVLSMLPVINVFFFPELLLILFPLWLCLFFSLIAVLVQKLLDPMFKQISAEYER